VRANLIVTFGVVLATLPGLTAPAFAGDLPPSASATSPVVYRYPAAASTAYADTYFGTNVADPYHYLENPTDPRTKRWVAAEASLARRYLDSMPSLASRTEQVKGLWNYTRFTSPEQYGNRLFWTENDGLRAQPVVYWSEGASGVRRVALDPNVLSSDGTVSIGFMNVSPDGRLIAYGASDGGSDWRTIRVRNVDTGQDLPDIITWAKFTEASWSPDSSGFTYSSYPEPANPLEQTNSNMRAYFHKLGTTQADDRVIYADPAHPEVKMYAFIPSGDVRRWFSLSTLTSENQLSYQSLATVDSPITPLIDTAGSWADPLHDDGNYTWILTNIDAPNYRVVRIDLRAPARENWVEIVPEQPDVIDSVTVSGTNLVVSTLHDVTSRVRIIGLDGVAGPTVELPGLGGASDFTGSDTSTTVYYRFDSFTSPSPVMALDIRTGKSTVWKVAEVGFDPSRFVTKQVFVTSKDGTKVPAFIVHRKGVRLNGLNPTLLYGYGGFNISMTAGYSPYRMAWLERGGVYVHANLRGGGEYGKAWHDAGTRLQKQNVFDDFIAVAEYLVDKEWTSPARLAIEGGSNGGLLVGAAITQRPELFGAAIPQVGVLDMLRYHRFTIGAAWAGDYGRSDDSPTMFKYLLGYSPLHNVRPGVDYPATLVMTGERDDRVVPAHSFKFGATLQADNASDNPIIVRVETRAGHGAGTSTEQAIAQTADKLSFLDANLGTAPVVPKPVFLPPRQ
jgi:prolyl oligopeptidase